VKPLIGVALIVGDVIAVKALMIASHAPHAGNRVAEAAVVLMVVNVVVIWLLGKSKSTASFGGRR
jgi:hypothetical protein